MNLLVVGASHRTAPVEVLERMAAGIDVPALQRHLMAGRYIDEVVVLSTCNRVEVYAAVSGFHGGLAEIADALADASGAPREDISGYLYVRHETQAIRHAFSVAAGLDSLVAGESQILGQLRDAYDTARDSGSAARMLHEVMQQALRVGKRVHSEAHIDEAAPSVVTAALDAVDRDLSAATVLVVGAGAMGALAAATLRRRGVERCLVTNRDAARAQRVAELHGAEPVAWKELPAAIAAADVIVTATGANRPVLDAPTLEPRRPGLVICDLAIPRDVTTEAASLPDVTVLDISSLQREGLGGAGRQYLEAAGRILEEEVTAFENVTRAAHVAPTVAALRTRAEEVVDAELSRLRRRTPDLSDELRGEVAHTVHRVVRQLLHQPTVRVRQLANEPGGEAYAEALRELFSLRSPGLQSIDGDDIADALRVTPPDTED